MTMHVRGRHFPQGGQGREAAGDVSLERDLNDGNIGETSPRRANRKREGSEVAGPGRTAGPRGHRWLVQSEPGRESWVMRSEKWAGARSGSTRCMGYKLSGFVTSGCSGHLASAAVWG